MKRVIKIVFSASFIFYLSALAVLLFLRGRGGMGHSALSLLEGIRFNSNFIPFKTISTYIQAIFDNSMNSNIPIINLFGNLLMFLPMGIYFPFFSSKANKPKILITFMLVMLLSVETIQLVTSRGSFDVDDIILNMTGALMGFCIWKTQLVQRTFISQRERAV